MRYMYIYIYFLVKLRVGLIDYIKFVIKYTLSCIVKLETMKSWNTLGETLS